MSLRFHELFFMLFPVEKRTKKCPVEIELIKIVMTENKIQKKIDKFLVFLKL